MSAEKPGWSSMGFAKTFVLPGFLIFLVPVAGFCFFLHAQSRFNADVREAIMDQIRQDQALSAEERQARLDFFAANRISDLMKHDDFAAQVGGGLRFDFATFRWMIRLSALSILASVVVFALAGMCVLASLPSQRSQYLSLSVGWQVLRIYAAFQTLVQGIVVVALSYWVTALWAERYYPKFIFIAGAFALIGVIAVIKAIFQKIDLTLDVEGALLDAREQLAVLRRAERDLPQGRHVSAGPGHRRHRRQLLRNRGARASGRPATRRADAVCKPFVVEGTARGRGRGSRGA